MSKVSYKTAIADLGAAQRGVSYNPVVDAKQESPKDKKTGNVKEGQEIWGRFAFQGRRDDVGKYEATVYTALYLAGNMQTVGVKDYAPARLIEVGEVVDIWGFGMLDKAMVGAVKDGEFTYHYLGSQKIGKGKFKGRPAHMCAVHAEWLKGRDRDDREEAKNRKRD